MSFRSVLFWLHLAAGLVCGALIGLLCFTGTALAFEKQLVSWSERDARTVTPPAASAPRLSLAELQSRLRTAQPDARPTSLIVQRDPSAAVALLAARGGPYYLNPYTGELREPASRATAAFMQTMVSWHRYLGFGGETSRPRGKLVNGLANLAFTFLAISGLVLWLPRTWSWRAVRPSLWFRQNASSRARDFNWHNTIGFWCAPILIALTLTALPISFRWAGSLLYTLTGTPLPASGPQSSGAPPPAATVPPPPAGAAHVPADQLLAAAQTTLPAWHTITLRLPAAGAAQPATLTVRESATWPRTAVTTLQYDPFTAQLLRRDGYADLNAARQIRAWTRYLHTGEALGPLGQFVAGLACLRRPLPRLHRFRPLLPPLLHPPRGNPTESLTRTAAAPRSPSRPCLPPARASF
jgi:uncharacterized iron-regulated membrane protein